MPKTILLVCTGNSCRSVMAEGLLKKMLKERGIGEDKVVVKSRGVSAPAGAPPTKETVETMWSLGIDVAEHRAARLGDDDIKEADLILVMDRLHKEEIVKRVPASRDKIFLLKEYGAKSPDNKDLEIPDPIGRPIEVYKDVLIDIQEALKNVIALLEDGLK